MSNTRVSHITFLIAVVGALECFSPTTARSTTYVMMDEATLLHSSDIVVVGTVTGIESAVVPDGSLYTYVHVQPDRLIKGTRGHDPLVVREPGGTVGDRQEVIFGVPEFWVGERSLLFLSHNPDGTLQTNSFSMGTYTVAASASGQATA